MSGQFLFETVLFSQLQWAFDAIFLSQLWWTLQDLLQSFVRSAALLLLADDTSIISKTIEDIAGVA